MNIFSNAILYKDTTQWLRGRFFGLLFIGLLAASELCCVLIVGADGGRDGIGRTVFTVLTYCLGCYLVCVAGMGHSLAVKEFENRTFELYELSGMSLEKMIGGKLASLFYQFVFGFFCVIPFAFFSFYLGGISFSDIAATSLGFLLAAPYFLLAALFSALIIRTKAVSSLGRIVVFGVLIFGVPLFGEGLFFMPMGFWGVVPWWTWLSGLFAYLIFCALLFYLCCAMVSPSTDSRELPIKLLICLLLVLTMVLGLPAPGGSGGMGGFGPLSGLSILPLFFIVLLLGFFSFYRPAGVPLMARIRRRKAKNPLSRMAHFFFEPGPRGAVRTILFIALLALAKDWVFSGVAAKAARAGYAMSRQSSFLAVSFACFHLAFPGALLMLLPSFEKRNNLVRALVMAIWVMGAVLAGMMLSVNMLARPDRWISAFMSPFFSIYTVLDLPIRNYAGAWWPGMAGLLLMWASARARERRVMRVRLAEGKA